ncbi:MAG TPA: hypothetical protein ENO20_15130 [Bacteroides sp.]|nr:hypothetical protein [Bacteroides sp.]
MTDRKIEMMTHSEIAGLVEGRIRGTDIYLVDVSVKPGNAIQVTVDRPGGITIDECADISRFLNESMDRDTVDYALEVSSPGVGTPFRVRQQYENHIGRGIEVVLKDGGKFEGILDYFDGEILRLVTGGKEKEFALEQIKTTKATISFK